MTAVKITGILAGTVIGLGVLVTGMVWGAAWAVDLRQDLRS